MKNRTTFTQTRPDFAKLEEEVLQFWDETNAFAQSVQDRPADNAYVFYDGPPFANGLPHYGHLLSSTSKDVFPRYQTMRGKRVERVWGWDCHGVPIENAIEKELGLTGGKKGIEALGVHTFNDACRSSIMKYDTEWKKTIKRLGRWVDFDTAYKTMDASFMESVWWGFSKMYEKGLVYQGRKVVLYCPRCSTPLSNFEIAMDNSYKDVQDWSLIVKFALEKEKNTFVLAWTTTPWTLPGNVALAVHKDAEYVCIEYQKDGQEKEWYWVAKERLQQICELLGIQKPTITQTCVGKKLEGRSYTPLYTYLETKDQPVYFITSGEFVSLQDGTGIVHTAALYGEDDYELAKQKNLPCIPMLDDQGKFLDFVTPLAGQFYKKSEDWIVNDLTARGLMLDARKSTHSYPFCYRCGTALYFNALPAWFIDVAKIKNEMVAQNKHINWYPEHLKEGRFGKGLLTAPDWNISRSRYWGTPMPIWEETGAGKRKKFRVIGSIAELKKWAVDPKQVENLTDLHREYIDPIDVWVDDEKTIKGKRIFEVFDCWVESGSMPFAQLHYPFENKEKFDSRYPAQFITEYIAQTRAWFYCMHVISVAIFGSHAFENCLTTGTILAKDGQKMSKSKKNYPDPMDIIHKYGSDALRLYLMSTPIMHGENLNFSEDGVHDIQNKVVSIVWNVYGFWDMYCKESHEGETRSRVRTANYQLGTLNILDQWILSRLSHLVSVVTIAMDTYDVVSACRLLIESLGEFSTWYLRLSRERLKDGQFVEAREIFRRSIAIYIKLFAPLIPFICEHIYQGISDSGTSVHLTSWPDHADMQFFENDDLEREMKIVQVITEKAHAQRKDAKMKVRQPLASLHVYSPEKKIRQALLDVLALEVNVEEIVWHAEDELRVQLDTVLTPDLVEKGQARDAIRVLQDLRKQHASISVGDMVDASLPSWPEAYTEYIKKRSKVRTLTIGVPQVTHV